MSEHCCTMDHRLCVPNDEDEDNWCNEEHPTAKGWVCSRAIGHTGPHIACKPWIDDDSGHNKHIWGVETFPLKRKADL